MKGRNTSLIKISPSKFNKESFKAIGSSF